MHSDRHNLAAEIFVETMDLDAESRARRLASRCGGDAALRAEVESLLAAHDGAARRMETPAAEAFVRAASGSAPAMGGEDHDAGNLPGSIGPYRILGLLGEGGMGRVYLAEQDQPKRRVALKVIRAGAAPRSVLRRFEREAAALARLQHPGIAHVYQTGTSDTGRGPQPFLAMELVEGLPLTRHAREHRLNTRQKLELIARVCDAIQHAHERGIIHRDLKPANVLVIDEPTATGTGSSSGRPEGTHEWGVGSPKVLDFGVARLTDDEQAAVTAATSHGQLIGTLAYMSPEQVSGGAAAVDVRSDVYALGVMLYETLSGRLPIDARSMSAPEAVRAIRQDDPPTLSSLDRSFRGDVETIVAKALEKDPARRYQSAAELAADLRRHLADQPIVAHPPSTLYQFAKFAQRNRGLVIGLGIAAAVLVLSTIALAIIAGVAISQRDAATSAQQQADQARTSAEEEARTARRVNAFLNEVLIKANPVASGGRQVTVAEIAEDLESRLDSVFGNEPEIRAALQGTLARIFLGQGKYAAAVRQAEASYQQWTKLLGEAHRETIVARIVLGGCLHAAGETARAEDMLRGALVLVGEHLPLDIEVRSECLGFLSASVFEQGRAQEAAALCEEWIALLGENPQFAKRRRSAQIRQVSLLNALGRTQEAYALAESILPEVEAAGDEPTAEVLEAYMMVGRARASAREYPRAEIAMRRALELADALFGDGHPRWLAAADGVAGTLAAQYKFDEAEPIARRVLEARRETLGPDHPHTLASLNNIGWLLARAGRHAEAEPAYREALDAAERRSGPQSAAALNVRNNLAVTLIELGRFDEALPMYEQIVPTADAVLPEGSAERGRYRHNLGRCLLRAGRFGDAQRVLLEAYQLIKDRPSEKNLRRQTRAMLVEAYEGLNNPEEAAKWAPEPESEPLP